MWAIVFALLTGAVGQGLGQTGADYTLSGDEPTTGEPKE
jgi:hypothetical protein